MIEIEKHDDTTLLRLAHGKASAFDLELCRGIDAALKEFEASDARALVVTGTGAIFSAGVDLVRLTKEGAPYVREFLPAFESAMTRLFRIERPVVCAINGHAIAGGCVLAAAGDRRLLAAGRAKLGVPELLVGVPFPGIALELMRGVLAPADFQEAVYTGRSYGVEDAERIGLVDEVVEPEMLVGRALEVAASLAALPTRSFAVTKRMVRRPLTRLLDDHASEVEGEMLATWCDPDVLATVAAYVERTLKK